MRIVVVHDPSGRRKEDCFFTTDLNLSAKAILELFAMRWPREVAFYNSKQFPELQGPQNRTPQAVQRTAPLTLYLHTLVILWFAEHGGFDAFGVPPGSPLVHPETHAVVGRHVDLGENSKPAGKYFSLPWSKTTLCKKAAAPIPGLGARRISAKL